MRRKKITGKFNKKNTIIIIFCLILAVFRQPSLYCLEIFGYKTHPNFGITHSGKTDFLMCPSPRLSFLYRYIVNYKFKCCNFVSWVFPWQILIIVTIFSVFLINNFGISHSGKTDFLMCPSPRLSFLYALLINLSVVLLYRGFFLCKF